MLKKIEQAVSTWMWKLVMPVIGALTIGLLTIVLNQADNRVSAAEKTITKTSEMLNRHCADAPREIDKKLAKKVDNKHFDALIGIIREEQKEQKTINRELIDTMQELKVHIKKE